MNTHSLALASASSQYASLAEGSQTGLKIAGVFSIEAWIKTTQSDFRMIYQSASQNTNVAGIRTFIDSGKASFTIGRNTGTTNDTDYKTLASAKSINDNIWHHVAFVYNGSTMKIYVDGTEDASVSWSNNPAYAGTTYFLIGALNNSGSVSSYWNGNIDELRVWNDERTSGEILANYLIELVGNESNLQGYWKFSNNFTDETSNNNDFTGSGTPTFSTTALPFTLANDVSNTPALFDNLIAYYEMEEASGNRTDVFGGHTLTDVNTVASAAGKVGDGADLELSNSEYLYNTSTDFHRTGANLFSVSGWMKAESLPGSNVSAVMIVNKKTSNSVGDCFKIGIGKSNHPTPNPIFAQTWASSGGFLDLDTIGFFSAVVGTWYHVVFVKAATNDWKLYVNGVLIEASTATRSNDATGLNGISIGAEDQESSGVGQYFDGVLDEIAVFDTALTDTDVRDLYNNGEGLPYVGSTDITMTPSAQVATFSIPQYFVLAGDILVQAAAQVVTASIPAFSVLFDRVFGVAAQVATFSVPSRTVSIREILTPVAQVATFSIPAYSVQFGQTIAVGVQTATFSIPAYSVTAETAVHPSAQVATFSIPAYSITLGILMTPLTQLLTFTLPTLYKVGAIWTKIARSTSATWSRTSRNSN